ncbi:MAG TPA: hypothetical protein VGS28_03660 [Candidatus Saccharimonadales bacterium]|nr:hypothetical protein [Candidatus Saccharimonadales bacterium]
MSPKEDDRIVERTGDNMNPVNSLATTLYEASLILGSSREIGRKRIRLEGTNLRELFPKIPADAEYVDMQTIEDSDYSVLERQTPQAGLTITIAHRDRYPYGMSMEQLEPLRLGVSIENESGSLFASFEVPMPWDENDTRDRKRGESQPPPRLTVTITPGAEVSRIIASSKLMLQTAAMEPEGHVLTDERAIQIRQSLDFFEGLLRETGIHGEDMSLSEDSSRHLEEWANLYLYNMQPTTDPSQLQPHESIGGLTDEEEARYQEIVRGLGRLSGVRYESERLGQPEKIGRLGKFSRRDRYVMGCAVDDELRKGARAVSMTVLDSELGVRYRVAIAPAPKSGKTIPRAGRPDDYVLRISSVGPDGVSHTRPVYRYLAPGETHAALAVGGEFRLPGRGFHVQGTIQELDRYK